MLGDLVGVDDHAAGGPRCQGEGDEGRLAGAIGSDNEIDSIYCLTEVPPGRYSTMSPASFRATVVLPCAASASP